MDLKNIVELEDVPFFDELDFDKRIEFSGLPPLDKSRKIKMELLRMINNSRIEKNKSNLYLDEISSIAAYE